VGAITGLILALRGWGVWALVAQQIAAAVIEVVVLWVAIPWRPQRRFVWSRARDLLGFSAYSTAASLGNFVSQRSDAVVIGLFFGPVAVGVYRLALRLIEAVMDVSSMALQSVSLPELARLQDVRQAFGQRLLEILRVSGYLTLPLFGALAVASDHVAALLGPEWSDAADLIKVLAFLHALALLMIFVGPVLQALGKTRTLALLSWFSGIISVGSFVAAGFLARDAGPARQVLAMGWSRAAGLVVVLTVVVRARRYVAVRPRSVLAAVAPGALVTCLGLAAAWCLQWVLRSAGAGPLLLALTTPSVALLVSWSAVPIVDRQARQRLSRVLRGRIHGSPPEVVTTEPTPPLGVAGS
jgi:O-antigen/teichoic acid export membrane protein